jgi:outer membrane lipoprotein-sorting protein
MKKLLVALSTVLLATSAAQAQKAPSPVSEVQKVALSPAEQAVIQRASDYFNGLGDLVGEFMQINPNGEQVAGKFYLSRPGKVRFDYAKPSTLQVISDGTTVAVRDRKLNTQDLYFLAQTPLRILLAERVDLQKDAKVLSVSHESEITTIVIEERSIAGSGKLSVVFEGAGFELRQWTVTDPQGLNTTVAIYNIEKTKKLDPSIFRIRFDS